MSKNTKPAENTNQTKNTNESNSSSNPNPPLSIGEALLYALEEHKLLSWAEPENLNPEEVASIQITYNTDLAFDLSHSTSIAKLEFIINFFKLAREFAQIQSKTDVLYESEL